MSFVMGRYRIQFTTIDANDVTYPPSDGDLELFPESSLRGLLTTEGPITQGSYEFPHLRFSILHNGCLPFWYEIDTVAKAGTWCQHTAATTTMPNTNTNTNSIDNQRKGTLEVTEWICLETSEERTASEISRLPVSDACRVRHVHSVPVPCCACDTSSSLTSRLEFYELTVPHFGSAELLAVSCTACSYRHNKLTTTAPAKPYGTTLTLRVFRPSDLDRVVVLTEAAVVTCDGNVDGDGGGPVELEMRVGTGRYTTAEGILRGCLNGLKHAHICSDGDDGNDVASFERRVLTLIDGVRNTSSVMKQVHSSFVIRVEDPLGLSFVDGAKIVQWNRTTEQDAELGISAASHTGNGHGSAGIRTASTAMAHIPTSEADTAKLLKACEAMAAEYTKEYVGGGDAAGDDGTDCFGDGTMPKTDYSGCD